MRRNDAVQVYDLPVYNKIFPFMMKRRCDSLVYNTYKLDVTETIRFIREYNRTNPQIRLKFFYVFLAALMRTIAMRPELNRFIASNRYWQRKDLSLNFVVKEDFTEESNETSTPLFFRPDMVLDEYVEIIDKYVNDSRESKGNDTESFIHLMMHVPYWLIGLTVKIIGFFEKLGFSPRFVSNADGLHTSVFVSNLGSIGAGASPLHHLYEWGTTSIFVTLGGMERKRELDKEGNILSSREVIEMGMTVDERISSGFYFMKSIQVLQNYLNNPALLLEKPQLPPATLTKEQWKAKVKALSKENKKKNLQ